MYGDPSSILIANAYAFGARRFDTNRALAVMRKGADSPGTFSQRQRVRPMLRQYLAIGFVPGSLQLEYNSSDFAIGEFTLRSARDTSLAMRYRARAATWAKLFNPKTRWLQSRRADGSWLSLEEDWIEASYQGYFWLVPFGLTSLMDSIGGKDSAQSRLDALFRRLDADYEQLWFGAGNEPSFQIPWIYNWAGAPFKTQAIVRRILRERYSSQDNGLPGNDDLGAMGAWYVFASIGLYPMIPGVGGFAVNSPFFRRIDIVMPTGKRFQIDGGSDQLEFISAATLNGKSYDSSWLPVDSLLEGGTLHFTLSPTPNKTWGTHLRPPSY